MLKRTFATVAAAGLLATISRAETIGKADNLSPLGTAAAWVGGVAPTASDRALFDARLTQTGPFVLGANLTWGGVRVENPLSPVLLSPGSTLSLGAGGIDLSTASRSLEIQGPLNLVASQTWSLASPRTLSIAGSLGRANGTTLDIALADGAGISIASATPASLLLGSTSPYATLNRRDFAAISSTGQVVSGATVSAYTPNPASGIPTMAGTFPGVVDVVNSGTHGIRLGNSLTITQGLRFAAPQATADQWLIDAPSGRTLTVGAILIAPEVGSDRVVISGTGFLRGSNNLAAGGLVIHQHNPNGEFEVAVPIANYASYFTRLTKTGAGSLVLSANSTYTGATDIWDGGVTIRGDNTAATGAVLVHAPSVLRGTGTVGGATTILPGATLAPDALTFKGALSLQGETLLQIDGTAVRGVDYDTLTVASPGTLSYGGNLVLSVNQVLEPGDHTLRLLAFSGTPSGSFASVQIGGAYQLSLVNTGGVWTAATGGVTFSYSQATGELTVNVPVTQTNGTLILISENTGSPRPRAIAPPAPARATSFPAQS